MFRPDSNRDRTDYGGILMPPDGYRLDGMGHNISCSGSLTFTGDVKDLKVNGVPIGVVR